MRWGFLGTGRVTNRMADAVRATANSQLIAVASRELSRAAKWSNAKGNADSKITPYGSYQALLDDPAIDWVYNALPPSLHHEWTIQSLNAGKHVLCEKPLCLNHAQAREVQSAARQSSRLVVEATAYPYHPRSQAARNIVRSNELGELRRVTVACSFSEISHRGPDHRMHAELGGGALLDLGWYCVHATLWMTGLSCVAVQAVGAKQHGVWSQVQALAELSNGAVAHWDCGFDAAGRKWIEIAGTQASWICDDFLRPWNLEQPRFWVHASAGKARGEVHGANHFQEVALIETCSNASTEPSTDDFQTSYFRDSLSIAVETHRVLDAVEKSIGHGRVGL
jgi:predicted dehydrogenase